MHTDHPFTEKQDVFQLPDFAAGPYSVICDFDGTVTPFDVTDAILERFARPAWKTIEDEWVRGAISARQCMERQIPLIEAPLERLDAFLDTVPVTGGFVEFVRYSRSKGIPLGIVSDGMDYPIKRILNRHGLRHVPVVANRMVYREGAYRLEFPYGREGCASGVCKCGGAEAVSGDGKTLLIGDGLSDCCLARSASFTLARQGKALHRRCAAEGYPYFTYLDFFDILEAFGAPLPKPIAAPAAAPAAYGGELCLWNKSHFEGDCLNLHPSLPQDLRPLSHFTPNLWRMS